MKPIFAVLAVMAPAKGYVYEEPLLYDSFPNDFAWGVATSAYQVRFIGIIERRRFKGV